MPSDRLQHRPLVCPCVEGLECIGRRPSKGQPTFLALLYPTGKCVDPNACSSNLDCDENECCAIVGTGFDPPKRCIPLGGEGERCAASYNPERPLGCPCAEGLTCEVTEGAQKTFLSILHPTGRCRQA
ncbi:uncharacterized protein LOC106172986 [Lingula anatina]|uniref:Uncharacterized protein LOC106172986 n=1 Tax=Lingula anatina TaxID=7574 RepID=A0A1S3JG65_LINAN|nr:uncharacterized protein LOC106172986 [Lingula anatina]|eukprot:XP_013409400.1 uncharacterized protein LOC106172986 [Lingula anatina]